MSFKNDKEFDAKLMNFDGDRYDVVVLASKWRWTTFCPTAFPKKKF